MPIDTVGIPFSTLHKVTSEHVALSATCAMLRFRRSLANLICSPTIAIFCNNFLGSLFAIVLLDILIYLIIIYNVQIYEKYFIIIWVSVNN